MKIENILNELHSSISHRWYFQVFTAFTRILLAIGFIPPSYTKIIHQPFTLLPDSHPVGHYFNALYQTGFYYEFLGWGQMIAAILLLFPRTAHWGALMFLPIIVNIAVLTASVGFKGTWILTLLMSFAALWLVAWDYDRLKPILFSTRRQTTRKLPFQLISLPIVFAAGGALMAVLWAYIGLGNFNNYFVIAGILSGIGLVFGFVVALHLKFMKVGELWDSDGGNIL